MYILPQILDLCSKNLIIDNLCNYLKIEFTKFLNSFICNKRKSRYIDCYLDLQKLSNKFLCNLLISLYETIDSEFKKSEKRKENYIISKSNVSRTLVTIFGELTFKRTHYINKTTGEYYYYVDDILGLESYKSYDPVVRAILVQDSTLTNPNHTSMYSSLNALSIKEHISKLGNIPRQTIYKFKQEIKLRNIEYDTISTNKTLYVMADEKWIHKQDKKDPNKKKFIMSKCFVTFTGIQSKGKRNRLIGRHIFITSSDTPWKDFMNEIWKIYDFEKIETINLLSDAGSWILSGAHELKLYTNNKVIINTCEFHVKQKINRSTTDKELRKKIADIIYEDEDKENFIKEMDKLIEQAPKDSRKEKITEYKNYILNHWKGIINMKYSLCKSSMESHIQHCIASVFSEVPKAYSEDNIEIYLKERELMLNNIPIFDYYLKTYNSDDDYIYGEEKEVNYSMFEKSTSNVPALSSSSNISKILSHIIYSN